MTPSKARHLRTAALITLAVLAISLSGCGTQGTVASSWPGLTADETTAYLAFNQAVYAVDLSNGLERWRFPAQADRQRAFYAPPALTPEGTLIVGGFDGVVNAVDTTTGVQSWQFNEINGRIIGGITIAGDLALVPSSNGTLYALDRQAGSLSWSFETSHGLWSAPLVVGETVYQASLDHSIYALNLLDGELLWSKDLGGALADTPTLADDQLLAGTFTSLLTALSATGEGELRSFQTTGWVWGNPAVDGGSAYFGDVKGVIYAVQIADLKELWRRDLGTTLTASPVIMGDNIYFLAANGVYAFQKAAATPLWQKPLQGELLADAVIVGDTLLVASTSPTELLVALDVASGTTRWTFAPTAK